MSPSLKKVAYAKGFENDLEIWIAKRTGSDQRRLTNNYKLDEWPSWAPGSKRIVVSRRNTNLLSDADLFVVNVNGATETKIAGGADNESCPDWSSDGRRIAFEHQNNFSIYTIRPDGSKLKRITTGPGSDWAPLWSPNSRSLLFTRVRGGGENLYVIRRSGRHLRRLTHSGTTKAPYGWSPDGKRIAYISISDASQDSSLWVMRRDGTHKKQLASHLGSNPVGTDPTWFRGHHKIAYARRSADAPHYRDIWIATTDGLNNYPLTSTPNTDETTPDWRYGLQECRSGY